MSKNASLTKENHQLIFEHNQANSKLTHEELAKWAKEKFKLSKVSSRTTITKSLKRIRTEGPGNTPENAKRKRDAQGKYPVNNAIKIPFLNKSIINVKLLESSPEIFSPIFFF